MTAAEQAEGWLTGHGQFVADVLILAARGAPLLDVVKALLKQYPDPYYEQVTAAALRAALRRRAADDPPDSRDVVDRVGQGLEMFEASPEAERLAIARLVGAVLQTSPWPEDICLQIFDRVGAALSLNIQVRRR